VDIYRCPRCSNSYPMSEPRWVCDCGSPLELESPGPLEKDGLRGQEFTLWRYVAVLPIRRGEDIVSLGEGWTPLVPLEPQSSGIYVKLEFTNPTGSFKDRGASVLVSKLKELGVREVVEDSSGNAGAALAAYCARAGIDCHIYAPAYTSPGKLRQIPAYGADLVLVEGSRKDTAQAVLAAASKTYYASHVYNPLYLEGTKTVAYELWEQLGWRVPRVVVMPIGHGGMLLGIYKGFSELLHAGYIGSLPRLVGVQARACAPLAEAFQRGASEPVPVEEGATAAEGIKIVEPVRGVEILAAIRQTGGACLAVSEEEIEEAGSELGRRGFYVEPTSAAALAGFERLRSQGPMEEKTVIILTGSGLKAT